MYTPAQLLVRCVVTACNCCVAVDMKRRSHSSCFLMSSSPCLPLVATTPCCLRNRKTISRYIDKGLLSTREGVWSVSTPTTTKLYGCKKELEKEATTVTRPTLILKPVNAKKATELNFCIVVEAKIFVNFHSHYRSN